MSAEEAAISTAASGRRSATRDRNAALSTAAGGRCSRSSVREWVVVGTVLGLCHINRHRAVGVAIVLAKILGLVVAVQFATRFGGIDELSTRAGDVEVVCAA